MPIEQEGSLQVHPQGALERGHARTPSNFLNSYLVLDIYEASLPERSNESQEQNHHRQLHNDYINLEETVDLRPEPNGIDSSRDIVENPHRLEGFGMDSADRIGMDSDREASGISASKQPDIDLIPGNDTYMLGPDDVPPARRPNAKLTENLNSIASTRTSLQTASTVGVSSGTGSDKVSKSSNNSVDFDRYGFKKSDTQAYKAWQKTYQQYEDHNLKKWRHLLQTNGLANTGIPKRFPPKSDKVKKLLRKGIPYQWRGNAWFFYAGGYEKLNRHVGVYEQIVRDTEGVQNKDTEVIERDLNRTFPDNIHFNSNLDPKHQNSNSNRNSTNSLSPDGQPEETEMIRKLRRVLVAFAHFNPQIGYCQLLNFIAGLLLLFMNEEYAFWMLIVLTERIIPKVHLKNLEGVHIDQGVLMLCVKEYIPEIWSIIGRNFEGTSITDDKILTRLPPVTLVTLSWFMSVFIGSLLTETVLRIWDILWYEGSKTIFRISLTLCRICMDYEPQRKPAGSGGEADQIEYIQFIQNYPKTILDPNIVIDKCFKKIGGYGFGSLSQDEINQCREFVLKQRDKLSKKHVSITTEMSEQERRFLENETDAHDIYGFHRSIMNGMVWNKNISSRMKRLTKKK